MSNVAKLKKQAAEFEQKKQFDKALALYVKLLDSFDENADELDVALFNRVGDLMLRQGNVADAVDYYEKAIERYADTGFFNNAIALCNKVLRHSPGRASVYYKLGKISAHKGFKNDAKVNFLEYADRMQKSGKVDEAFRALKEFADLCPDQDEIRLMLADQLTKLGRSDEAIEQLQILYARYESDGRAADASVMAERIREIDPRVELKSAGGGRRKSSSSDLVFLDLDAPSPVRTAPAIPTPSEQPVRPATIASPPPPPRRAPSPAMPAAAIPAAPIELSVTRSDGANADPEANTIDAPLSGIMRIGDDAVGNAAIGVVKTASDSLLGLESTRLADDDIVRSTPSGSLLDFEPTSLDTTPVYRSTAPTHAAVDDAITIVSGDLELIPPPEPAPNRPATSASTVFDEATLITPPDDAPGVPSRVTPDVARSAFDGLPRMDLDLSEATENPVPARPRTTASLEAISLSPDLDLIELADEDVIEPADTGGPSLEFIDLNDEMLTAEDEPGGQPTPPIARRSTLVAIQSMETLRASVQAEPENWHLHRGLAEAMLEAGDRDSGIRELEVAMLGAEHAGDLDLASALSDEMARLEPAVVRHHQKRVEYAFRTNDRPRLVEAYLSLADALLRSDQSDKARTVYQRVIDLAPEERRAHAALESLAAPTAAPALPPQPPAGGGGTARVQQQLIEPRPSAASGFVNLGDWLRDDEAPKDTRMVVAEQVPSGDEDADFADMLRKFKQGVAENVDAEDYQSHYDLGIAFKEMGLLDEAVAEFQKALGSPTNRLPTYEALGQCFLEKRQPKLAMSILTRGFNEQAREDQLVGVLYWLGRAAEELGLAAEALGYYQRVFVLDIQFRDTAERMNDVERAAR